MTLVIISVK